MRSPTSTRQQSHKAVLAALIAAVLVTGCTSNPNTPIFTATSRIHAQNVPDGSLRAGEVVLVLTREQIKEVVFGGFAYEALTAAGVPDKKIGDGSVVLTRVFCCGGPNEKDTALMAFVPEEQRAEVGDIIEIWSGRMVKKGEPLGAMPNTMIQVREKANASTKRCRWMPDRPGLWMRVIYCEWMPAEGWSQQGGLYPVWIKPIAASTPPI